MSNINIRRDVKDSFYRYKMPRLVSKIEGKGNGIKTVISNMSDVARALSRPPSYPTKFFGIELGAQVKIEDKNDRYIVNGVHEADKLQSLLDVFITKFVLCASCKSPETDLVIKDGTILRQCMACGKRTEVDMRHRLSIYILKNPPPKVKKSGQHAAPDSSSAPHNGISDSKNPSDEDDDQDELTRQITNDAANLKIDDSDSDRWDIDADVSEEAVARRQRELAGSLTLDERDEFENDLDSKDPYDELGDFITEGSHSDKEIFAKSKDLGLSKKHRATIVIIQCLFTNKDILGQIQSHASLLRSFGDSEKHQKSILGGFERLLGETYPELMPRTSHIFKALYEEDIVDEDSFLVWSEKPSKKYTSRENSKKIHEYSEKFIQWLKEAEEDDSEEDSD
ncbi:putative eukaryotic translation initiation factor 5 [Smittium mucronatum]|uniref:Putative eukaryotic translation initiation factor 5 n=1 Tax=Smittium mucronatum TaxID=133383 RepID=A0A1R0H3P9_9FUNG|nr:putative eukaryotic translation initiation factor 5 [Smittium mucronatum]